MDDTSFELERKYPYEITCNKCKNIIGYSRKLLWPGDPIESIYCVRKDGTKPVSGLLTCDEGCGFENFEIK